MIHQLLAFANGTISFMCVGTAMYYFTIKDYLSFYIYLALAGLNFVSMLYCLTNEE